MNEKELREIGIRIQICRKQRGYTQEILAEKMNVSIQMISNLERGNKAIRIDNLVKLSEILNISTDYILTGKETLQDISIQADSLARLNDKDRQMIEMLINYCALDNQMCKK